MRSRYRSICGSDRASVARFCGLFGLCATLVAGRPAVAEDAEAARQRLFREQYERAGNAYKEKDYAAAIPALQAAFAIQPQPRLLFNIAQAYRRLEKWSSARVYFEMYRSMTTELPPAEAENVDELLLEVMERERGAQTKTQVVERTRLIYVQSEKPLPRWLRPFGVSVGVAGLGLLAGGGVFLGLDGRCRSAAVAPALECDQLYTTRTLGTALTAVGAGLFVIGAVTFGVSLRRPVRPVVREAPAGDPSLPELPSLPSLSPAQVGPDGEPPPVGWNLDGTRAAPRRSAQ